MSREELGVEAVPGGTGGTGEACGTRLGLHELAVTTSNGGSVAAAGGDVASTVGIGMGDGAVVAAGDDDALKIAGLPTSAPGEHAATSSAVRSIAAAYRVRRLSWKYVMASIGRGDMSQLTEEGAGAGQRGLTCLRPGRSRC